ncbi:hypothetical protein, partial [Plasmodium yoelii yoelii]
MYNTCFLFDETFYLVKLIICIIYLNLNYILITEQYNNFIYQSIIIIRFIWNNCLHYNIPS